MCGEGCLGGGLEVVCRVFLYSSYTHPIFVLYKTFETDRNNGAWRREVLR